MAYDENFNESAALQRVCLAMKSVAYVFAQRNHLLFLKSSTDQLHAHMRTIVDFWIICRFVSLVVQSQQLLALLQVSWVSWSSLPTALKFSSFLSIFLSTCVTGTTTLV